MTEPSQYFKGRTVQEQMDEVIGYVDKRAEEVAAAKADDVLQPAEDAKTAAQAAAQAAEAAKNATIAALPQIQQDIAGLKAEDTALDGRLDTVELKVQTAEGNIVTIQGQIVALQNMQGDYVKKAGEAQTVTSQIMVPTTATGLRDTQIANGTRIQNDLDAYAHMVRTSGNQKIDGIKAVPQFTFGRRILDSSETVGWRKVLYTRIIKNSKYQEHACYVETRRSYEVWKSYSKLEIYADSRSTTTQQLTLMVLMIDGRYDNPAHKGFADVSNWCMSAESVTVDGTDYWQFVLWQKNTENYMSNISEISYPSIGTNPYDVWVPSTDNEFYAKPTVGDTYAAVVDGRMYGVSQ